MVSQGKTTRTVKLTFKHDTHGPVFVVGTFNGWNTDASPMKKGRNGAWQATLRLLDGEHEFRYFAGGHWFTDYAADGVVPNGFGGFNSLLTVPQVAKKKPAKAKAN